MRVFTDAIKSGAATRLLVLARGASQEGDGIVRRSLARYLTDTSSNASLEFAFLAAAAALAIVFGLMQLGSPGRSAARTLLRLRNR